jgi:hypothetical protein
MVPSKQTQIYKPKSNEVFTPLAGKSSFIDFIKSNSILWGPKKPRTPPKITYRQDFVLTKRNPFQILYALKYRIFVILVIVISTPVLYASNANSPQSIEAIGYEKILTNGIVSKINKVSFGSAGESVGQLAQEVSKIQLNYSFGKKINSNQEVLNNIQGVVTDQISKSKTLPLNDLVSVPQNPQLISFLRYPQYNINVPVQYAGLKDLFVTDDKGNFLKDNNGSFVPFEEDVARDGPLGVPIQRLLIDGIVHIGFTPQPGEIGNSYIVGHSSNFSSVQSNYNYILKPLQQKSEVGEEFFIYDKSGRELKFKVFEVKEIWQDDTNTAYLGSANKEDLYTKANRRVVTLQCSILDKNYQPTKRWLTRGELVL